MFHQEIAALDWRTHELADVVDEFVVVESVSTHSGMPRSLVHPERFPQFAWLGTRLHGAIDDDPPAGPDAWLREHHQREAIWTRAAAAIATSDDDLVIISDIDEVPFPELVDRLAWATFDFPVFIRPMWFNFDWDTYLGRWDHASIRCYPAGVLRALQTEGRSDQIGSQQIPGREIQQVGGWHASWFGSDEELMIKLAAYAHFGDDKDRLLLQKGIAGLADRRESGWDMFGTRRSQIRSRPRLPVYGYLLSTPV